MKRRSAVIGCMVVLLLASLCAVVSAYSESWTLTNWDINCVWGGDSFTAVANFSISYQWGSVQLANDTNNGKFCFSVVDGSNTGWSFEIYPDSGSQGYLKTHNDITFIELVSGSPTTKYAGTNANGSSCRISYDGDMVSFYINGVKVYQKDGYTVSVTGVQDYTACVPVQGSIEYPSDFTGSFYVSVSAYSSSGLADMGSLTGMIIPLMVALLPVMIYMAVFKLIPRMLKGIKL